jgi:hypothetical protein
MAFNLSGGKLPFPTCQVKYLELFHETIARLSVPKNSAAVFTSQAYP